MQPEKYSNVNIQYPLGTGPLAMFCPPYAISQGRDTHLLWSNNDKAMLEFKITMQLEAMERTAKTYKYVVVKPYNDGHRAREGVSVWKP